MKTLAELELSIGAGNGTCLLLAVGGALCDMGLASGIQSPRMWW